MLIISRFRSASSRVGMRLMRVILAMLFVGIGSLCLYAADDDEEDEDAPAVPPPPGRVAEEVDIFKQRAREMARKERQEAKTKKSKKTKTPPTVNNFFNMSPTPTQDTSDGFGMIGNGGYLAGKTFGRQGSISKLEAMPYILSDEHFIFSDIRGFISNYSYAGGNLGVGYRYLREDWNSWGGASVWYDADQTSSKLFQQVGLSFEGLIQQMELRSNVYLPVTSSQTISNTISNASIVGNQLLFGRSIDQGTALKGFDGEIGYSHPIQERHVIRGFIGGYHFSDGPTGDVNGFKLRAEAVYNNGPSAQVLYTSDKLYGNNLMVGVTMQFPFGNNHPTSGWKRHTPSPFRYVERNYNVIVGHEKTNLGNQVATDANGDPYKVEYVYAPSGGGGSSSLITPDGTADRPFTSIADAQAAGGNLIIVKSGSVIDSSVTLTDGQKVFGEGNYSQLLGVQGGGTIQMQSLLAPAGGGVSQSPIFTNSTGNAITMASNTEVAGFNISNSGGGIVGNNLSNVTIHDVKFLGTGGDAIHLTNSSGNLYLNHIQINNANGNGIVIDQGTANVYFDGTGNTITTQGDGFVLSNLTDGSINLNNLAVSGNGGSGLKMSSVGTGVTVNNFSATQTFGPAVAITGTTGTVTNVNGVATNVYDTYNFTGLTSITSPRGTGFSVNGTDAVINVANLNVKSTASSPAVSLVNNSASAITINNIAIDTTNAKGIYALGLDLLTINGGTIKTVDATAVDILNSTINTKFNSISVDGGTVGISLVQSTGAFAVVGNGSYGTGGTIQNTNTGVLINNFGSTTLSWMNFTNNATGIQSNKSSSLTMAGLQIGQSTGYAIDSLDDSVLILNSSVLAGNGAIGGGSIRVQADATGTFSSNFTNNQITDSNGTAIQFLTQPSAAGASLATTIQSNTLVGYRGGSSIIGINWNGPASVNVSSNAISLYGSSMTGVQVLDTSTTDSLALLVAGNGIAFAAGANSGTAVQVNAAGTSQVQTTQNQIDFKATGGIGLRYSLGGTTTNAIVGNIITDEAGGATGMLFDTVAANSRIQLDGNTINLLASDLTTHQGIIFTSVTPTIQFSGTTNNLVYNASTPQTVFSIPVNAATGGFYINGSLVN